MLHQSLTIRSKVVTLIIIATALFIIIISSLLASFTSAQTILTGCPGGTDLLEVRSDPANDRTYILEDITCKTVMMADFEASKVIVRFTPNYLNNNSKLILSFSNITFIDQEETIGVDYTEGGVIFESPMTDNLIDLIAVEKCTRTVTSRRKNVHSIAQFLQPIANVSSIIVKGNELSVIHDPFRYPQEGYAYSSVAFFRASIINVSNTLDISRNVMHVECANPNPGLEDMYSINLVHFADNLTDIGKILVQNNDLSLTMTGIYYPALAASIANFSRGISNTLEFLAATISESSSSSIELLDNRIHDSVFDNCDIGFTMFMFFFNDKSIFKNIPKLLVRGNKFTDLYYTESSIYFATMLYFGHGLTIQDSQNIILDNNAVSNVALRNNWIIDSNRYQSIHMVTFTFCTMFSMENVVNFQVTNLRFENFTVTLKDPSTIDPNRQETRHLANLTSSLGFVYRPDAGNAAIDGPWKKAVTDKMLFINNVDTMLIENCSVADDVVFHNYGLQFNAVEFPRGVRNLKNLIFNNISLQFNDLIYSIQFQIALLHCSSNSAQITDRLTLSNVNSTIGHVASVPEVASPNFPFFRHQLILISSDLGSTLGDHDPDSPSSSPQTPTAPSPQTLQFLAINCFIKTNYSSFRNSRTKPHFPTLPTSIMHSRMGEFRGFASIKVINSSAVVSTFKEDYPTASENGPAALIFCTVVRDLKESQKTCLANVESLSIESSSVIVEPAFQKSAGLGLIHAMGSSLVNVRDISISNGGARLAPGFSGIDDGQFGDLAMIVRHLNFSRSVTVTNFTFDAPDNINTYFLGCVGVQIFLTSPLYQLEISFKNVTLNLGSDSEVYNVEILNHYDAGSVDVIVPQNFNPYDAPNYPGGISVSVVNCHISYTQAPIGFYAEARLVLFRTDSDESVTDDPKVPGRPLVVINNINIVNSSVRLQAIDYIPTRTLPGGFSGLLLLPIASLVTSTFPIRSVSISNSSVDFDLDLPEVPTQSCKNLLARTISVNFVRFLRASAQLAANGVDVIYPASPRIIIDSCSLRFRLNNPSDCVLDSFTVNAVDFSSLRTSSTSDPRLLPQYQSDSVISMTNIDYSVNIVASVPRINLFTANLFTFTNILEFYQAVTISNNTMQFNSINKADSMADTLNTGVFVVRYITLDYVPRIAQIGSGGMTINNNKYTNSTVKWGTLRLTIVYVGVQKSVGLLDVSNNRVEARIIAETETHFASTPSLFTLVNSEEDVLYSGGLRMNSNVFDTSLEYVFADPGSEDDVILQLLITFDADKTTLGSFWVQNNKITSRFVQPTDSAAKELAVCFLRMTSNTLLLITAGGTFSVSDNDVMFHSDRVFSPSFIILSSFAPSSRPSQYLIADNIVNFTTEGKPLYDNSPLLNSSLSGLQHAFLRFFHSRAENIFIDGGNGIVLNNNRFDVMFDSSTETAVPYTNVAAAYFFWNGNGIITSSSDEGVKISLSSNRVTIHKITGKRVMFGMVRSGDAWGTVHTDRIYNLTNVSSFSISSNSFVVEEAQAHNNDDHQQQDTDTSFFSVDNMHGLTKTKSSPIKSTLNLDRNSFIVRKFTSSSSSSSPINLRFVVFNHSTSISSASPSSQPCLSDMDSIVITSNTITVSKVESVSSNFKLEVFTSSQLVSGIHSELRVESTRLSYFSNSSRRNSGRLETAEIVRFSEKAENIAKISVINNLIDATSKSVGQASAVHFVKEVSSNPPVQVSIERNNFNIRSTRCEDNTTQISWFLQSSSASSSSSSTSSNIGSIVVRDSQSISNSSGCRSWHSSAIEFETTTSSSQIQNFEVSNTRIATIISTTCQDCSSSAETISSSAIVFSGDATAKTILVDNFAATFQFNDLHHPLETSLQTLVASQFNHHYSHFVFIKSGSLSDVEKLEIINSKVVPPTSSSSSNGISIQGTVSFDAVNVKSDQMRNNSIAIKNVNLEIGNGFFSSMMKDGASSNLACSAMMVSSGGGVNGGSVVIENSAASIQGAPPANTLQTIHVGMVRGAASPVAAPNISIKNAKTVLTIDPSIENVTFSPPSSSSNFNWEVCGGLCLFDATASSSSSSASASPSSSTIHLENNIINVSTSSSALSSSSLSDPNYNPEKVHLNLHHLYLGSPSTTSTNEITIRNCLTEIPNFAEGVASSGNARASIFTHNILSEDAATTTESTLLIENCTVTASGNTSLFSHHSNNNNIAEQTSYLAILAQTASPGSQSSRTVSNIFQAITVTQSALVIGSHSNACQNNTVCSFAHFSPLPIGASTSSSLQHVTEYIFTKNSVNNSNPLRSRASFISSGSRSLSAHTDFANIARNNLSSETDNVLDWVTDALKIAMTAPELSEKNYQQSPWFFGCNDWKLSQTTAAVSSLATSSAGSVVDFCSPTMSRTMNSGTITSTESKLPTTSRSAFTSSYSSSLVPTISDNTRSESASRLRTLSLSPPLTHSSSPSPSISVSPNDTISKTVSTSQSDTFSDIPDCGPHLAIILVKSEGESEISTIITKRRFHVELHLKQRVPGRFKEFLPENDIWTSFRTGVDSDQEKLKQWIEIISADSSNGRNRLSVFGAKRLSRDRLRLTVQIDNANEYYNIKFSVRIHNEFLGCMLPREDTNDNNNNNNNNNITLASSSPSLTSHSDIEYERQGSFLGDPAAFQNTETAADSFTGVAALLARSPMAALNLQRSRAISAVLTCGEKQAESSPLPPEDPQGPMSNIFQIKIGEQGRQWSRGGIVANWSFLLLIFGGCFLVATIFDVIEMRNAGNKKYKPGKEPKLFSLKNQGKVYFPSLVLNGIFFIMDGIIQNSVRVMRIKASAEDATAIGLDRGIGAVSFFAIILIFFFFLSKLVPPSKFRKEVAMDRITETRIELRTTALPTANDPYLKKIIHFFRCKLTQQNEWFPRSRETKENHFVARYATCFDGRLSWFYLADMVEYTLTFLIALVAVLATLPENSRVFCDGLTIVLALLIGCCLVVSLQQSIGTPFENFFSIGASLMISVQFIINSVGTILPRYSHQQDAEIDSIVFEMDKILTFTLMIFIFVCLNIKLSYNMVDFCEARTPKLYRFFCCCFDMKRKPLPRTRAAVEKRERKKLWKLMMANDGGGRKKSRRAETSDESPSTPKGGSNDSNNYDDVELTENLLQPRPKMQSFTPRPTAQTADI